jgi:hypothetical protein
MSTADDYRQLSERCLRLARVCPTLDVAESLVRHAADYSERATKLGQPAIVKQQLKKND